MMRRKFLSEDWCAADRSESFFVGDAGGRSGDFSDSDKWAQPSLAIPVDIAVNTRNDTECRGLYPEHVRTHYMIAGCDVNDALQEICREHWHRL